MNTEIGTAVQQTSDTVYLYAPSGAFMTSLRGRLVGYTPTTVSIAQGQLTYVYSANGAFLFCR